MLYRLVMMGSCCKNELLTLILALTAPTSVRQLSVKQEAECSNKTIKSDSGSGQTH